MENKILIGSWITLNHPSVAEILADAGFDWLCIDLEHSVTDYFEAQQLITTIQSKGIEAFVRVGENNERIIKRVLDAGADGIIIPMVKNVVEAKKAINAVKYPPIGNRGVGLARAQNYGFGFEKYRNTRANKIKLIVQIEHIDAMNNLENILNLEHIDGTFIGPYDLSGSMGKPGRFNDVDVKNVLQEYETIAKKYDKLMGFHVIEPLHTEVLEKIKRGYNFIAFSIDTLFLGTIARDQVSKLKN
ncbi:aldolase/citrate lyase family protein [Schleiferiaceae bacterium]|nr:aldolase/citrate lyase family protein [Schleiferiaceae bacterium]